MSTWGARLSGRGGPARHRRDAGDGPPAGDPRGPSSPEPAGRPLGARAGAHLRRLLGAVLTLLVVLPVYRVLATEATGLAGRATMELSETNGALLLYGTVLVLIPAVLAARFLRPSAIESRLARVGALLTSVPSVRFAAGAATVAGLATLAFSLLVLDGKPNLIDAMSQLVHARYLAEGRLAGPASPLGEFWHVQNTLATEAGWVSQYPPLHAAVLALGFRAGAVWAVGPLLMAVTVFFTSLAAERLLPGDRGVARLGAALVALSPFLVGLAGAYMNHITAAAFASIAVFCALRARDGRAAWALGAGASIGAMLAARPLSAVSIGGVVVLAVWLTHPESRASRLTIRQWARRLAAAGAGALPFLLALGLYNARFFGSPLRFGYVAAYGPTTAPGFHRDPWGNVYGLVEAVGYTASDLLALSIDLLETPLPTVAVVGLFLVFARRLSGGERVIAAWALAPVLANMSYWHHGIFMGPRMLNEAAPAWILLAVIAAVGLVRAVPGDFRMLGGRYSPRAGIAGAFLVAAIVGLGWLAPQRMASYGGAWQASTRVEPPRTPFPALVFVHGGWSGRIGMRLAAHGMRLDSVESALRQNSTCDVHIFARAYAENALAGGDDASVNGSADSSGAAASAGSVDSAAGIAGVPSLDFTRRASAALPEVELPSGEQVRVRDGERFAAECESHVRTGRTGIVDVTSLLWQGDLPGLPGRDAMLVRDMGPEANAKLIERYPERRPMAFFRPARDADPVLAPYGAAMARLWGHDVAPGGPERPTAEAPRRPRRDAAGRQGGED